MQYRLFVGYLDGFEAEVNRILKEGWQLHGSTFVVQHDSNDLGDLILFGQAFVRKDNP